PVFPGAARPRRLLPAGAVRGLLHLTRARRRGDRPHGRGGPGRLRESGRMNGAERFLAAARRRPVDCTPVWFMRQAGRCLADYRELRKRHDILTLAKTPELSAQVTLMPVDAFGVDAAVMF